MKRIAMQKVVARICVETDCLYEWIRHGEAEWKEDYRDLMSFLKEADEKGFNVERGCYSYKDKIAIL